MFKKPKTEVKLELKKTSMPLGSKTVATITVSSKEEFDATEIRAELRCIEKVRRERWVYNERLRRNVRHVYWDSATLVCEDLKANGSIHIVPGFKKKFEIKVHISTSGRETFDGIDRNVSWLIKGVVAVNGRPDAVSETTKLQIFRPSGTANKEEIEMVPCEYCRALIPVTSSACPICGAPRKS
ncbi:MAG: hypothetical protein IAX21_01610 [Candidatus Bathyarchaeota archaeon]|nr:MAG: hypothetical protein IAX21_01610 [Candidatus Bathyarchaeota archaeon]